MKRRVTVVTAAVLLAGAMLVGVTYAYLVSRASPLVNTFVSGDIEISLTESTGSTYTLVPGCTLQKDPRITVKDGSEECWLFFRLEDETPEGIVAYSPDDGWNALSGEAGVYWRRVSECREDKVYSILKGDCITVVPTATEEKLAALGSGVKLSFTAYAVQYEGIPTAEEAWNIIKKEGDKA